MYITSKYRTRSLTYTCSDSSVSRKESPQSAQLKNRISCLTDSGYQNSQQVTLRRSFTVSDAGSPVKEISTHPGLLDRGTDQDPNRDHQLGSAPSRRRLFGATKQQTSQDANQNLGRSPITPRKGIRQEVGPSAEQKRTLLSSIPPPKFSLKEVKHNLQVTALVGFQEDDGHNCSPSGMDRFDQSSEMAKVIKPTSDSALSKEMHGVVKVGGHGSSSLSSLSFLLVMFRADVNSLYWIALRLLQAPLETSTALTKPACPERLAK